MSNAQDLLSILSNAGATSRSSLRPPTSTSGIVETSILSLRAGKMNATFKPNGKYLVEPDARRGEIHVVYCTPPPSTSNNNNATAAAAAAASAATLKLEWRDRRTKTTVNSLPLDGDATFERVETGRDGDRVYLLQRSGRRRNFFWMQDKDADKDEELCVRVNLYIGDRSEAASAAGIDPDAPAPSPPPPGGGGGDDDDGSDIGMDSAELLRMMRGALGSQSGGMSGEGARMVSVPGSATVPTAGAGQVDALGNILENLGLPGVGGAMPSGERDARGGGASAAASSSSSATTGGGGGLTLADLRGAMAGLATASPVLGASAASSSSSSRAAAAAAASSSPPGPPLSELASADVVDASGILDDPSVVSRLIALLPEGQQTEAALRESLRSPQVAQCLRRLTSALAGDDDDDEDGRGGGGFNSIIANFRLNPEDGAVAMAAGNPVEAFLNCLLRDVERKEGVKENDDDGGGGGGGGGDDADEEGDGDDGVKGDGGRQEGDVNMDES